MSRAELFLRGGTPCTEIPELIEVLSDAATPYTRWRVVAYYPGRWLHDAVDNRTTAPLFLLLFASNEPVAACGLSPPSAALEVQPAQLDCASWHLLCHTVLPSGAIPTESFHCESSVSLNLASGAPSSVSESVTSGGGGVGALRTLLRTVPAALHPSESLEWFSVVDGQAYARMGLISESVFANTVITGVAEVLSRHWRTGAAGRGHVATARAHFIHDARCKCTADLTASSTNAAGFSVAMLECPDERCGAFVEKVARDAVQWMCSEDSLAAFTADASVPSLSESGCQLLYPIASTLPPCLFTSLFVEAAHVDCAPPAPLPDPETLAGLAKLRAERDAGIAQWKQKIGEYTTFTVPEAAGPLADEHAAASATRPFQHVLLLQRPIVEKQRIDADNRDPGPLAPQPIGAELHLLQDRGDVHYALEQLGNRANVRFSFGDTIHDDGEVLVQLAPVEGIPFCDLERYFQLVPSTAPVLATGAAACCAGSCCSAVVPRVVYRRPTGRAEKPNPIAHAQTELEVLPPTPEMLQAAVTALQYVAAHAEPIGPNASSTATAVASDPSVAETRRPVSLRAADPKPGYTLHVPPVDVSLVPTKRCGWCGRRREQLLRCGGCKAVCYCCKRHQVLDWKEGSHKLECKLWKHARELQESVVGPWAVRTALTWTCTNAETRSLSERRKRRGWSCAATLVDFIAALEALDSAWEEAPPPPPHDNNGSNEVVHLHVVGLDTQCVDEFVQAMAESVIQLPSNGRQYRILICSDTFTDAQRNAVWALRRVADTTSDAGVREVGAAAASDLEHVSRCSRVWLTPATGVLGDTWHCEGGNQSSTCPPKCAALIRLCGVKYHHYERGSGRSGDAVDRRPAAVLSFGPAGGEGCTYLTAALEVFASHDAGVVPLRFVDSSYVGAVRTRDAFASRISNSDSCTAAVKNSVAAFVVQARKTESTTVSGDAAATAQLAARRPLRIRFNEAGAVPIEALSAAVDHRVDKPLAAGEEVSGDGATSAAPSYINSYLFDLFPADV